MKERALDAPMDAETSEIGSMETSDLFFLPPCRGYPMTEALDGGDELYDAHRMGSAAADGAGVNLP